MEERDWYTKEITDQLHDLQTAMPENIFLQFLSLLDEANEYRRKRFIMSLHQFVFQPLDGEAYYRSTKYDTPIDEIVCLLDGFCFYCNPQDENGVPLVTLTKAKEMGVE